MREMAERGKGRKWNGKDREKAERKMAQVLGHILDMTLAGNAVVRREVRLPLPSASTSFFSASNPVFSAEKRCFFNSLDLHRAMAKVLFF
ncbi:hypothetical protein EBZ37_11080 [bacterium]|nr:hypothetical protein [bacterium]